MDDDGTASLPPRVVCEGRFYHNVPSRRSIAEDLIVEEMPKICSELVGRPVTSEHDPIVGTVLDAFMKGNDAYARFELSGGSKQAMLARRDVLVKRATQLSLTHAIAGKVEPGDLAEGRERRADSLAICYRGRRPHTTLTVVAASDGATPEVLVSRGSDGEGYECFNVVEPESSTPPPSPPPPPMSAPAPSPAPTPTPAPSEAPAPTPAPAPALPTPPVDRAPDGRFASGAAVATESGVVATPAAPAPSAPPAKVTLMEAVTADAKRQADALMSFGDASIRDNMLSLLRRETETRIRKLQTDLALIAHHLGPDLAEVAKHLDAATFETFVRSAEAQANRAAPQVQAPPAPQQVLVAASSVAPTPSEAYSRFLSTVTAVPFAVPTPPPSSSSSSAPQITTTSPMADAETIVDASTLGLPQSRAWTLVDASKLVGGDLKALESGVDVKLSPEQAASINPQVYKALHRLLRHPHEAGISDEMLQPGALAFSAVMGRERWSEGGQREVLAERQPYPFADPGAFLGPDLTPRRQRA